MGEMVSYDYESTFRKCVPLCNTDRHTGSSPLDRERCPMLGGNQTCAPCRAWRGNGCYLISWSMDVANAFPLNAMDVDKVHVSMNLAKQGSYKVTMRTFDDYQRIFDAEPYINVWPNYGPSDGDIPDGGYEPYPSN